MSIPQSGRFDRKIEIYKKKWIKDDEGFQKQELVLIAKPWAAIKNITENVDIDEKETVAKERATFQIYYREEIDTSTKIKFNKKFYDVTAIFNPDFRNETLILTGERKQSRGSDK